MGQAGLLMGRNSSAEHGRGGADTTSGSFTIRVNTPPADPNDTRINYPWKSYPIAFTLGTDDVDPYDIVAIEIFSHPTEGYLDGTYYKVNGRGWIETNGASAVHGDYAHSFLYTAISSTFTGFDGFTYRMHDFHGGVTGNGAVTFEIFED